MIQNSVVLSACLVSVDGRRPARPSRAVRPRPRRLRSSPQSLRLWMPSLTDLLVKQMTQPGTSRRSDGASSPRRLRANGPPIVTACEPRAKAGAMKSDTFGGRRVLVAAHPVIREADSLRAHEILHAHGRALMVLGEYGAAREVLGRTGRPPLGSSRFPSRASPSWTSGGRRPEAYAGGIEAVRRGDGQANEHCLVTLALIEAGLGQERDCREHAR